MKKIFALLFIIASFTGCNFKKRIDHHGIHKLEEKSKKITVSETNKNEVISLLGPPSITSVFDNDVYIYIERKITTKKETSRDDTTDILTLLVFNKTTLFHSQKKLSLKPLLESIYDNTTKIYNNING